MRAASFASASTRRFLALGLIPLILVGLFAGSEIARIQREAVGFKSRLLAASIGSQVESFLSQPVIALAEFGHLSKEEVDIGSVLVRALSDHLITVESIFLTDHGGTITSVGLAPGIPAHPGDFEGLDQSRDPLYQRARRSGEPVWSGVFTSSVSGRRVLGLAVPHELGTAMATVEIESLSDYLSKVQLEPGTSVVIADRNGNVLFHTDRKVAQLRPNWSGIQPIAEGIEGRSGDYSYVLEDQAMFGSAELVAGAGWTVLVQQERDVAMAPVMNVWTGIGAVVVLVAIVAIVVALLFSRGLSRPIQSITDVAASVEHGDYSADIPAFHLRELRDLATSIGSMAKAVQDRERSLFEHQARLVEEYEEKSQALHRLSVMSAELSAAEERERRHLAEELHDRVSQVLAVARMRLGMLREQTGSSMDGITAVDSLIAEAVTQTREITTELAPPVLYEIGLSAAVADLCDHLARQHGLTIHVDCDPGASCLTDEASMAVFRATRELLMNVVKHANTDVAWVTLTRTLSAVVLEVRDDGDGVSCEQQPEGGFGLFSIRERLIHLDGSIELDSQPGQGTVVTVCIPCHAATS